MHQLLADEDRRGVYDETGEVLDVHEETLPEGDFPWTTYWRNLFPEVTPSAIDGMGKEFFSFFFCSFFTVVDFARKFRGSDEERDAVLAAYERKEGDMNLVVDEIMLAEPVDVGRFVQHYVLPAIASKKIRKYSALKRFEKAPVVERAANVKSKEEKNSDADLMKMIQSRKSGMDELVTKLASKYGDAKKKKGGKREPSPPDDEEFERIQKEMLERSRGANGKKGRK